MYTVITSAYADNDGSGYVCDIVNDNTEASWRVKGKTEKIALTEARAILNAQSTIDYQCVKNGDDLVIPD